MITKNGDEVSSRKFDHAFTRKQLAKMIIIDEFPLVSWSMKGLNFLCKSTQPKFHFGCHTTITNDCLIIYVEKRAKLYEELKGVSRVSLTTDVWTSIQNLGYMCITAHYIDAKWSLQKRIIKFIILTQEKF